MSGYKDTINLPKTDFPMKAGLAQREPEMLAKWEAAGLYQKIQENRKDAPLYLLHDGPPFANGDVHMGTALNKILKDFVIKSRTMASSDPADGFASVLLRLLRHEGPIALFNGWLPTYFRLGPHAILTFPLFEAMRRWLGLEYL